MSDQSSTFHALLDSTKRSENGNKDSLSLNEQLAAIGHKTLASAVRARPEMVKDRSAFFDLVQKDFREQKDAGLKNDPDEYCKQFSSLNSNLMHSIYRLVEVEQFFANNPDFLSLVEEPEWPRVGEVFDDFKILEELGRGAVSRVFRCQQLTIGKRTVVLKITTIASQEAWVQGKLDHPNIMPIHSVGISDTHAGLNWICMPYLGRVTLQTIIDIAWAEDATRTPGLIVANSSLDSNHKGEISGSYGESYNDQILNIALELSAALVYVHKHGILHGDLKPSNVLITPEGKPLLIDFNLSSDTANSIAQIGGTLPYMAPEQLVDIHGSGTPRQATVATEVYTLAKLILHALSGHSGAVGHGSSSIKDISKAIIEDRKHSLPQALSEVAKSLPSATDLLRRCLNDLPADRPQSLWCVHEELSEITSPLKPADEENKKRIGLVVAISGLVIVLVTTLLLINRDSIITNRIIKSAEQSIEAGDLTEAANLYGRLVTEYPSESIYAKKRAELLVDSKDYLSASEAYLNLAREFENPLDHAMVGYCLNLARKQDELAVLHYRLAEKQGVSSVAIRCNLAATLCEQLNEHFDEEKSKKIEAILQSALEMSPGNIEIRFQMLKHFQVAANVKTKNLPSYSVDIVSPLPINAEIKFPRYTAIFLVQSKASQSDLTTIGLECIRRLTTILGPNGLKNRLPRFVLEAYQALPGYEKSITVAISKSLIQERSYYLDPRSFPLINKISD